MRTRRFILGLAAALALAACGQKPPETPAGQAEPPLVYAASSLTDVMNALGDAFAATGKARPQFSFAASSELARQIEQGAKADIFISADEQWMDYLDGKNLIDKPSRQALLGNTLVLITPTDKPLTVSLAAGLDLSAAIGDGKLAMADPDAVPAGRYGREALTQLGAWAGVEGKVARAANVRDALRLVESGEAAAGIVYGTDARASTKVAVAGTFPESSHAPIVYPIALTAGRSGGAEFAMFLKSDAAKAVFERFGFSVR
jgi:molybdate transport system substrate-binding protein